MASVAAAVLGCGPQRTLDESDTDPIRIGLVTSLSGGLGSDGPGWRDAARLAVAEVNAVGGPLPGRPIELLVVDDQTNPELASSIANELVGAGVAGIIGAAASSISIGLAEVAVPAGIPQISCCSTSDNITADQAALDESERFFFRTAPSDALQSQVVALAAAEQLSCTRLAILHLDDSYGDPFGRGIETAFQERSGSGSVVARVPFAAEQATYATELASIADATPDCIALVAFPAEAGTIVRDAASVFSASAGNEVTWIGTDGVRVPGFVDEVGDPLLIEGFFGTSPITDAPTPDYNAFRDHFNAVFGTDPIPFSANQYDAVALLALAIAAAGTTEGSAVRDALRRVSSPPSDRGLVRAGRLADGFTQLGEAREIDYQGASGNTDFDELHNVRTPYEIWRYDVPSTDPCASATVLSNDRGSFCRFVTITAEELD